MTSSAQTPEPTDEQRAVAMVACGHRGWTDEQLSLTQRERVEDVARALAAAVTAEREKVGAIVELYDQGVLWSSTAMERIREVSR